MIFLDVDMISLDIILLCGYALTSFRMAEGASGLLVYLFWTW